MYVLLFAILGLILWAGSLLGEQNRPVDDQVSESFEKRMKMREEMHRRMMEKLFKGMGPSEDLFSDMEEMMDEMMLNSFNGFGSFSRMTAQNYKVDWSESAQGRTLHITPQGPEQQLDISVSNGLIEIKGKNESKTAQGVSVSNFSNTFNVPGDCDPAKVKMEQKEGTIVMFFPYRKIKKVEIKPDSDRRPLPPSESDVQI